ncbi:MAG: tRNA 2-selenouridine(34) synthase MnmH, partial [Spirochaetia bacterium]|nr:tRNA 2-selenouridine(34) synthase MnmH [Spirochaetia bacterium]
MSIPSKILKIHDFLIANPLEQFTIIDVRSPAEFDEDHVPGAVNQPVLNNEERAFIGTMHKQVSSFKAREAGARIISKNISSILENISPLSENKKPFIIYCWRGGMRSKSLFTVMDMIGYKTYILEGGYKSYRRTVHQTLDSECTVVAQDKSMNIFSQIQEFLSIHGYTGSGKTELLQLLCSDYPVIDLEKAAVHRGSLLGSFKNTPQPSQKRFETNLFFQIFHQRNAGRMLVEG